MGAFVSLDSSETLAYYENELDEGEHRVLIAYLHPFHLLRCRCCQTRTQRRRCLALFS